MDFMKPNGFGAIVGQQISQPYGSTTNSITNCCETYSTVSLSTPIDHNHYSLLNNGGETSSDLCSTNDIIFPQQAVLTTTTAVESEQISIQVFVPDYNIQKCWQFRLSDTIWQVKRTILDSLPKDLSEGFNFGLFLPPCNGRAGKFLSEERPLRDYPFQDCVPYLEFKYKKRVYKMMNVDEKALKQLHTPHGFKKFFDAVKQKNAEKLEKLCSQGFDPNFHDSASGETPLTVAASTLNNKPVILALVNGGAHLDFRSVDGQTALHKAACLSGPENVETLLALGSSPNYRDRLNLTPLYYCVLKPNSSAQTAEILLRDYSEVGVVDVHGNQEIHQACKNGLVGHLEHLLYYGTDINHRNVNGNTPLHVCAVNNQDSCARLLLFRGADASILNNQGQTAYHIATITGHVPVAEVIKSNVSLNAVPYRGQPRYNSKRRFTLCRSTFNGNNNNKSRSSSIASGGSDASTLLEYGTLRRMSTASVTSSTPSFSGAATGGVPLNGINPGGSAVVNHYGHVLYGNRTMPSDLRPAFVQALRDSMPVQVESTMNSTVENLRRNVNEDANIPRILVIPRGKKGFGFILRGAKKVDPGMIFQPTLEIPALQYFEGVDTNGMAMKAGLRPGDFLLEINNIDVRCASHDQVVRLIQMAQDTITLKVITVDLSAPCPYPYYATIHRNAKPANLAPYQSPRRMAQSLSQASGRASIQHYGQCEPLYPAAQPPNFNGGLLSKSVENLPVTSFRGCVDPGHPAVKVASVRNRPMAVGRRVSISEIEQLMQRHNGGCSNMLSTSFEDSPAGTPQIRRNEAPASPGPKVYASVADMKRQKKHASSHRQHRTSSGSNILTLRVGSDELYGDPESPGSMVPAISGPAQRLSRVYEHQSVACEFDPTVAFRNLMLNSNGGLQLSRDYTAKTLLDVNGDDEDDADQSEEPSYAHQMELNRRHWTNGGPLWNGGSSVSMHADSFNEQEKNMARRASSTSFGRPMKAVHHQMTSRPRTSPPPPPPIRTSQQYCEYDDPAHHQHHSFLLRKANSKPDLCSGAVPTQRSVSSASLVNNNNASNHHHVTSGTVRATMASLSSATNHQKSAASIPKAPPLPSQTFLAATHDSSTAGNREKAKALEEMKKNEPESDSSFKRALAQRRAALAGSAADATAPKNGVDDITDIALSSNFGTKPSSSNFEADLKSAIARRRNQLEKTCGSNDSICSELKQAPPNNSNKIFSSSNRQTSNANFSTNKEREKIQHQQQTNAVERCGTSLKESVANNIQKTGAQSLKINGESSLRTNCTPVNGNGCGFAKKDSGYTSSRNSLEPSECGEETTYAVTGIAKNSVPAVVLPANKTQNDLLKQSRVTVLSQQLEENISGVSPRIRSSHLMNNNISANSSGDQTFRQCRNSEQDSMSLASTLSSSLSVGSSSNDNVVAIIDNNIVNQQHQQSINNIEQQQGSIPYRLGGGENDSNSLPEVPPPDYDQVDSGTGESDADETNTETGHFSNKPLIAWKLADVCDWLDSMRMGEYKSSFSSVNVDGRRLSQLCDRAEFTRLGVTRVAHRIAMENSLKQYKQDVE